MKDKEGFARTRLTQNEVKAIFSVAGVLDNKQLGRDTIICWSSFLAKLKRFSISAYKTDREVKK